MVCEDHLPCEECRRAFAPSVWDTPEDKLRKAAGPPCESCHPPLFQANIQAIQIYSLCNGQWIMGPAGAVDINIQAVKTVMELEGVRDQRRCLRGVLTLARAQTGKWRKETEEDRERKR